MNGIYHRVIVPDKVLLSTKSKFQQIDVIELGGQKALIIDNFIQYWCGDEFIYHEMLAHFPLSHHPKPERILLLGAGDGFLLRELLKYSAVKEIVIVDIDEKIVEIAKEYFSEENKHSFDDPRVKVIIDDALHFADTTDHKFDVVIMDLIAYEAGSELYSEETVLKFKSLMKENGIFATHGDDSADVNHIGLKLFSKLSKLFPFSKIGLTYIPSFDSLWTFMVLSNHEISQKNDEQIETKFYEFGRDYSPAPFLLQKLEEYKKNGFEKFVETKFISKRVKLSEKLEDLL